jgi:hypothetical protein
LFEELSRDLDGELTPSRCCTIERHTDNDLCLCAMATRLRLTVAACRAEGQRRPSRAVMSRAVARVR